MDLILMSKENFVKALFPQEKTRHENDVAMYSSLWKGYVEKDLRKNSKVLTDLE
jgi:hypothetical protein